MLTQDQIETMRAIADKTQEAPGYDRVRVLPVWAWTSAWNGKAWVPVLTEAGREVLALANRLKPLDGPADPTAAKDLADALSYADEIGRDPTPPTSAMHRWMVVLARALRVEQDKNKASDAILARLSAWKDTYGRALCPKAGSADTYGDGVRAMKTEVAGMLGAKWKEAP